MSGKTGSGNAPAQLALQRRLSRRTGALPVVVHRRRRRGLYRLYSMRGARDRLGTECQQQSNSAPGTPPAIHGLHASV